jgi:glyoxylase-like metal-dependent hydrolase (beta-lactamase superfamily II)
MGLRSDRISKAANGWFRVREVASGVWLIGEPPHVNTWLVVGSKRAALIDSGLGVRPIRPVVEAITDLPILVLNTHSHFDHIGGNYEFDQILIHPDGVPIAARDVPRELLSEYIDYAEKMEQALPTYIEADRSFFFSLSPADEPRTFPIRHENNSWQIPGSKASGVLTDGYVVDLGGRESKVIATPGHSPDHVAFLLAPDGLLFAGDAISTGAIYLQWPESNVADFARSTMRLAELVPDIHAVLVHHWVRYATLPYFLRDVAEGAQELLVGNVEFRPNLDCSGQLVREALFEEFSIYLPRLETTTEKVSV